MKYIEAYQTAVAMGLEVKTDVPIELIDEICNGTGPEWMRASVRESLDELSETLQPAIAGHDVDYYFGTGKIADFHEANARLERNGIKCADAKYPWYRPMRYIVRRQAKLYRKICDLTGLVAYMQAVESRVDKEMIEKQLNEQENKT